MQELNHPTPDPGEIFVFFRLPHSSYLVDKIPTGHIHDTYILKTPENIPVYIFQRINNRVFHNIPRLMRNIRNVAEHFARKFGEDLSAYPLKIPIPVPTIKGMDFYRTCGGEYWRCYPYIRSEDQVRVMKKTAYEAGKAIGKFHEILSDHKGKLFEVIPGFHLIGKRFSYLKKTVRNNPAGRVARVESLISELLSRERALMKLDQLYLNGALPMRITHNDTKMDNILFDEYLNAIGIIDLDTVMSGTVLYDFGDAVRTLCNTAREDDMNLNHVGFHMDYFIEFLDGYLSSAGSMLQPVERDLLAYSCLVMTAIMAVRFLTDFLEGDVYFRIEHPVHNLHRAANQIRLLQIMERQYDDMLKLVKDRS